MNENDKIRRYEELLSQLKALAEGEEDRIVNMANFSSAIQESMNFFWTGFYRVVDRELRLGPFQGSIACTHIGYGKGVCGTAWKEDKTLIVPNVEDFPGHIACSSLSKSEIVVPVRNRQGEIIAVLDIDSTELNQFDETDRFYLEEIVKCIQ